MPDKNSSTISIGGLARTVGIAPSAVRYYESLGLLKPARTSGGHRVYEPESALILREILFARSAGFTLTEIHTLLATSKAGEPLFSSWRALAEKKLIELDEVIARAQQMKRRLEQGLACRCVEPETCPLVNEVPNL